jgi:hypothetical protein
LRTDAGKRRPSHLWFFSSIVYNLTEKFVIEFSRRVYKWPFVACASAVNRCF